MTGCPHGDCACSTRCLRSHCPASHVAEFDRLLQDARSDRLPGPVLTLVHDAVPVTCDGSMTCPCTECAVERSKRVAQGAGPSQIKPRPSRHTIAA